jgi:hypothetical protein
MVESLKFLKQLRRPDGIAVVGFTLGQLLMAAGRADEARDVLADSRAAAVKMGMTDRVRQIDDLLGEALGQTRAE